MMCAERVHKLLIAIILGFNMGLVGLGYLQLAFIIQLIVMIAFIVWALSGFCLSLTILKGILPSCDKQKKESK